MAEVCGASHPFYKKLFCCFCVGHTSPHGAPIRRGQWVEWLKAGTTVARRIERTEATDKERIPRLIYLVDDDYGTIGNKSKGRCWYCGAAFSSLKRTLDHVVPRSKGGGNDRGNLVFACQPCNTAKGSKSLDAYRQHVRETQQLDRVVFYGETLYNASTVTRNSQAKDYSTWPLSKS